MKRLLLTPRIEYIDHAWKYFVNESYITALQPYRLLIECPLSFSYTDEIAESCDGLLVTGGYDVAPHYFHQACHKNVHFYERPQDYYDFLLIDAFVKQRKPILGICRGLQLINVYFHGTLCQHFDTASHEEQPHEHRVTPLSDTIFTQLLKQDATINSYHHQCIDHLGEQLHVGVLSSDGRIEAIYHQKLPIIGVQWHPEKLNQDQIIPYFINQLVGAGEAFPFPIETTAKQK